MYITAFYLIPQLHQFMDPILLEALVKVKAKV